MSARLKAVSGCRYLVWGEEGDVEMVATAPGQESRRGPWAPVYDLKHQSSAW